MMLEMNKKRSNEHNSYLFVRIKFARSSFRDDAQSSHEYLSFHARANIMHDYENTLNCFIKKLQDLD
jgi:hypothetical protein